MAGIKRTRDKPSASDASYPSESPDEYGYDSEEMRISKKTKTAHLSKRPQQDVEASDELEEVKVTKKKTTKKKQKNMNSEASSSDSMAAAEDATTSPPPFNLLAPVLAADMANNTYAPTDAVTRQHYINEVGQRQLHPSRTPLQTPSSAVPKHVRYAIYERFFLGMTNEECIPNYNKHGGSANGMAAVSKALLAGGATWFKEEDVVLPWMARRADAKKRLKGLGLAPKNFPAPHDTTGSLFKKSKALSVAPAPKKVENAKEKKKKVKKPPGPSTASSVLASLGTSLQYAMKSLPNQIKSISANREPQIDTEISPRQTKSASADQEPQRHLHKYAYIPLEKTKKPTGPSMASSVHHDLGTDQQDNIKSSPKQRKSAPDPSPRKKKTTSTDRKSTRDLLDWCDNVASYDNVELDDDVESNDDVEPNDDVSLLGDGKLSSPPKDNQPEAPLSQFYVDDVDDARWSRVTTIMDDSKEPSIHEIIRAATNIFDIGDAQRSALLFGDTYYLVISDALLENCGFMRKHTPKGEECKNVRLYNHIHPIIVRAFIQCISPTPMSGLPDFDIKFRHLGSYSGYEDRDPVGLVYRVPDMVSEIVWDIYALVQLHELAVILDCNIVRDMVIDRIYEMYREELQSKALTNDFDEADEFELPFWHFTRLSLEKDAGFIKFIGDIYCDRAYGDIEFPKEVSDEMEDAIIDSYNTWQDDEHLEPGTAVACRRYHAHGENEPCYRVIAHGYKAKTPQLISTLFNELRDEAFTANSATLETDRMWTDRAWKEMFCVRKMMQSSLRREERIANALREVDVLERQLLSQATSKEDRKLRTSKLSKWQKHVEICRKDYHQRWKIFQEDWVEDDRGHRLGEGDEDSLPWGKPE
jgi:hypothetical protein